jgi:hypothetical protein
MNDVTRPLSGIKKVCQFQNNSKGHVYCLETLLKRQKFSIPDLLLCIQLTLAQQTHRCRSQQLSWALTGQHLI